MQNILTFFGGGYKHSLEKVSYLFSYIICYNRLTK